LVDGSRALLSSRDEFHEILHDYIAWRAQFLDAQGELQPRYRLGPMIASFMQEQPVAATRESIPVPKGPVGVW
jgi:hypothetical protein